MSASPNGDFYPALTVDREDTWIEDMLQVMKKITEPIYRDLVLKQLKCIVEIAA